jgi:shikimate dehydrogenase
MTGQPELELSLGKLSKDATVYDIVYAPLETTLLKNARVNGNECIDGLGMLLHQAAPGFEAWFGVKPDVDDGLRDYILKALK